MATATNRPTATETPILPAAPTPPAVIVELLARVRSAVVQFAPGSAASLDATTRELAQRYIGCSEDVRAALEASLNGLLARLSDPDRDPTELTDEIAALAVTCGELSAPHRAPGQDRLGVRLGGRNEPDSVEARTLAQAGEPARQLFDELDAAEATFADRLAAALKRAGLTQTELAEKLGVRPSAVSMMLRRSSRPQPRTVARIAAALNVSPSDLWPVGPPARAAEPPSPDPVTDMRRLRASELARLPRAVWEPILTAAAERAAEEYRADPEFGGLDAFVFEAQYIDGEKVPFRASELLRWPARLRDFYLTAAAEQAAEEYRTDPELSGLEAHRYESQFLDD